MPSVLPTGHVGFAPDLAIEVTATPLTAASDDAKIDAYRSAGVPLIRTPDVAAQGVRVDRPREPTMVLQGNDVPRGDPVLPGLAVAVREWPATPVAPAAGGQ